MSLDRCPYCMEPVKSIVPKEIHQPPDESSHRSPMVTTQRDISREITFDTVSCKKILPCGHMFREPHVDMWKQQTITGKELGDRVVNPLGDRQ